MQLTVVQRLIHPSAMVVVKINGRSLPERVMQAVWGYFSMYVAAFAVVMLALMAIGLDQITAFSAVVACLNNMGVGLGEVAANFGALGDPAKWVLCAAMILGRLEIFTLLVLLTPAFWQR